MAGKRSDRNKSGHPSSEDTAAFVDNRVSVEIRELVITHLAECRACRKLVAQIVSSRKTVRDPKEMPVAINRKSRH
jgi:hypothetical protein